MSLETGFLFVGFFVFFFFVSSLATLYVQIYLGDCGCIPEFQHPFKDAVFFKWE